MRIGVITPGFSAGDADWCIPALAHLVRSLAERHRLDVFALRHPPLREEYTAFGARVRPFAWGRAGALRRPLLLARALARIVAEGRTRGFDVLHGFWADEPGYLAVAAGRALGVPAVVSLLGGELVALRDIGYGTWLSPIGRALVRRALRRADAITVGSLTMGHLASRFAPAERLHPLPLGVDTRLFHPDDGSPRSITLSGSPSLLHVASLVPVKDQATLLRAFARAAAGLPGSHLHLVGDGPLRGELEALAAALGVGARVTFHGEVAHERLPDFYRAADLCVLASRFESQSMVALEAAACGRPPAGTAVGVRPELDGASRTVAVGDSAALAGAILELAGDPVRRASAGRAGLLAVASRFALSRTAAETAALYGRLAVHA